MKTVILFGESEADLKLILELAHRLGIKTKVLTEEDARRLGNGICYAERKYRRER